MKLNLTLIEKDPVLRGRLKEAAKHSVQDFFHGREPPEEALEYVVAAFCLGESDEQFNERLQLLFEKDCTPVVESLSSFVQNNPEFSTAPEPEKPEPKKETPKPRRQKIVWDTSLDKSKTESASEEKKKSGSDEKKKSGSEEKKKLGSKKKSGHKDVPVKSVKSDGQEHRKRESHGMKAKKVVLVEDMLDRWQPEEEGELEPEPINVPVAPINVPVAPIKVPVTEDSHERMRLRSTQRRVTHSRLFDSALNSIKQQFEKEGTKTDETSRTEHKGELKRVKSDTRNGHAPRTKPRGRSEEPTQGLTFQMDPVVYPLKMTEMASSSYLAPTKPEGSILDRIRKPDGSQFEDWELNRETSCGKKRQAAEPQGEQIQEKAAEMSEVESLKLKIARLEKEVQNVHTSPVINFYPSSRGPAHDFDLRSVCVKNVHFLANEEVVAAHFHSCQPIVKIDFAKDIYGQPKGFCFIQFVHEECVQRALELDQSLLLGRNISVVRKLARPPAPTPVKLARPATWSRPQWTVPNITPVIALKEDWNNGAVAAGQEIKDFAIDTGSQDML